MLLLAIINLHGDSLYVIMVIIVSDFDNHVSSSKTTYNLKHAFGSKVTHMLLNPAFLWLKQKYWRMPCLKFCWCGLVFSQKNQRPAWDKKADINLLFVQS